MCVDVLDEFRQCESLTDAALAGLCEAGCDLEALHRRWQAEALDVPRLDRVVHLQADTFEFAEQRPDEPSSGAMIFLVRDEAGAPIDLAAWSPAADKLSILTARGVLLGAEAIFAPRLHEFLPVHRTPLDWLREACHGVVILDARKAADLLRRGQPLLAASVEHGRALRRLLELPPPSIKVEPPT